MIYVEFHSNFSKIRVNSMDRSVSIKLLNNLKPNENRVHVLKSERNEFFNFNDCFASRVLTPLEYHNKINRYKLQINTPV